MTDKDESVLGNEPAQEQSWYDWVTVAIWGEQERKNGNESSNSKHAGAGCENKPMTFRHPDQVLCLSVSSGRLFTGCADRLARQWDVDKGEVVVEYGTVQPGHLGPVTAIALFEERETNREYLFTGGQDSAIIVWDVAKGEKLRTFPPSIGHDREITCLLPVGPHSTMRLYSASEDSTCRFWDVKAVQCAKTIQPKAYGEPRLGGKNLQQQNQTASYSAVTSLCLDEHGHVYAGNFVGTAQRWADGFQNIDGRAQAYAGHNAKITDVAVWANHLYTASVDQTVRKWDTETGAELLSYRGHSAAVECLQVIGHHVFSGDSAGFAHMFDGLSGKTEIVYGAGTAGEGDGHAHTGGITDLCVSGVHLFTAGKDGKVVKWPLGYGRV